MAHQNKKIVVLIFTKKICYIKPLQNVHFKNKIGLTKLTF